MKKFQKIVAVFMVAGLGIACAGAGAARLAAPKVAPLATWRDLRAPHQIYPYDGAIYYSFEVEGGSRAHLIVVDTRTGKWEIRPAIAESGTASTSEIALKYNASAAVNGGYFNLKDGGATASYVTVGGAVVADPSTNKLLCESESIKPFLPAVFDRTEVRFLKDGRGKTCVQIAKRSAPPPAGTRIVHALQGGPRLLPTIESAQEAFVRKRDNSPIVDSIGTRKPAARTAFGVTADGYAMFLAVSGVGQDPESFGVTLEQLAQLLKELGCVEAVNLDGGASTTMYVRLGTPGMGRDSAPPGAVVCGKNPETRVKSILMLLPANSSARSRFGGNENSSRSGN